MNNCLILLFQNLAVIGNDYTFASSYGGLGTAMGGFGTGAGCTGKSLGIFDIDLRGTNFQIKEGVRVKYLGLNKLMFDTPK
jgi:hypothetical protein